MFDWNKTMVELCENWNKTNYN